MFTLLFLTLLCKYQLCFTSKIASLWQRVLFKEIPTTSHSTEAVNSGKDENELEGCELVSRCPHLTRSPWKEVRGNEESRFILLFYWYDSTLSILQKFFYSVLPFLKHLSYFFLKDMPATSLLPSSYRIIKILEVLIF